MPRANGERSEGFFPVQGALRHIRQMHILVEKDQYLGNCVLHHQNKEAKISFEAHFDECLQGQCLFEDLEAEGEFPIRVEWSYEHNGLSIH